MFKVNGEILDRSQPLALTCAKCLAAPGEPCRGVVSRGRQIRKSNHLERWSDFVQLERDRGAVVTFTKTLAPKAVRVPSPRVTAVQPRSEPVRNPVTPAPFVQREPLPRGYERFMASERWAKTRAAAFAKHGAACRSCKTLEGVEPRHRSFERFMREYAQDLVPLCERCWGRVELLADTGVALPAAITRVVRAKF